MNSHELEMELMTNIWQKIAEYETIILHRHIHPDYDALGSVFALKEIISTGWPEKRVYVAGDRTPQFPLVPAADILADDIWQGALVIICDTSSAERVCDNRWLEAAYRIRIDHHQDLKPFGDLSWVDTSATATSQMIMTLYNKGLELYTPSLTPAACYYLLYGLMTDSGRLLFVHKDQNIRFIAALQTVLQTGDISLQDTLRELNYVEENTLRYDGFLRTSFNRPLPELVYAKVTSGDLERFHLGAVDARGWCNSLSTIRGVRVWALFVEDLEQDCVYCEFRSNGPNVSDLAFRYGGGGHLLASGCQAMNWQEVEQIISDLALIAVRESGSDLVKSNTIS
ncbi:MAG: bifunctional oligoribonuclease/PAP phosphatase NrnA [Symbiobacteriaceae bacterium]|nr:bifunctional oligoribonuclease/PAP phosphatase NrnA [Symbiobacteriaceae bacterium]